MTQAMTIRLPDNVYEALRRESFETRRPMNEIITEAVSGRTVTAEQFGDICNIIARAEFGIADDDPYLHTSDAARAGTIRIIEILGLEVEAR